MVFKTYHYIYSVELKNYQLLINNIDAANTHRLIASRQSAAYKDNKQNLASDTLMIELDWKQKILIGQ